MVSVAELQWADYALRLQHQTGAGYARTAALIFNRRSRTPVTISIIVLRGDAEIGTKLPSDEDKCALRSRFCLIRY